MTPSSDSQADSGRIRVLLVEDAMDQAHLVTSLLRSAGPFDVTHAQDGDRALKLLEDRAFHLVITDLNLPGTDGFEVIRAVRKSHPETHVMAATGYTNPQYAEEAFRAGAAAVVLKPLERDDLLRKVREVLGTDAPEEVVAESVLAVGARPGDLELGCGATLLNHRDEGKEVLMVVLSQAMDEEGTDGADAARHAAEVLGVRLILADESVTDGEDPEAIDLLLERIAKELRPVIAYTPSLGEDDSRRREAHRLARSALDNVPEVRTYLTGTTTLDFAPTLLEETGDAMMVKLEALTAYREVAGARQDLSPRFAQAAARWWGRLKGFQEVEPFEVDGQDSGE